MTIATQAASSPIAATAADDDHEQVVIRQDPETGLRFIVAVHSTVLGPSLGGMRVKRYPGGLREALEDVMGLARTMTLKASAAGLDLGGGKSVMIDDGRTEMRRARLQGAARTIEALDGAYITAEDIGTTCADMDYVARYTRFCVGRSRENGGGGDPSPVTAETVFQAIRRGLEAHDGSGELDGRRVRLLRTSLDGERGGTRVDCGDGPLWVVDSEPVAAVAAEDEDTNAAEKRSKLLPPASVTVSVPPCVKTPPPLASLVLPVMSERSTTTVPSPRLATPPPSWLE